MRQWFRQCRYGLTRSLFFAAVPFVLNYQAVVTDSGGTPLPSGPVELTFRITDQGRAVLYEERQTVDANKGVVTALIGNGLDPASGAPANGLTPELFSPGDERFLEVLADGVAVDDPLEIVAVPYALWSQRVAEGAVDTAAIAPQAITMTHLADALIDQLAETLAAHPTFQQHLAAPTAAAQIGVNTAFLYSGATTVQGVLKDLDLAIKVREEKNVNKAGDNMTGTLRLTNGATVTGLPSPAADQDAVPKAFVDTVVAVVANNLNEESKARADSDATLKDSIASEDAARTGADAALQNNIASESVARAAADAALQNSIASESVARAAADAALQNSIASENAARTGADAALQNSIASESVARGAADAAESQARTDADAALKTSIIGANNSLGGEDILDSSIGTADIGDGVIQSQNIADGTIGTEKLAFDVATQEELDKTIAAQAESAAQKMIAGVIDLNDWDETKQNYQAVIPKPPMGNNCTYSAAFAGTTGPIRMGNPNGVYSFAEIQFDLSGDTVWCKVFSYQGDGATLSHLPCRVSYLTICL